MSTTVTDSPSSELFLSPSDVYRAAAEGVLTDADAERLVRWGHGRRAGAVPAPSSSRPEQQKGLNFVTVAYYFGAMLMISACAWFLGDKWDALGSPGVFATALIYMAVASGVGWWLRSKRYLVGGGLLITVAVCLVPLLTYAIEDMLGLWPAESPGAYSRFYIWVHGSWIVMELATIAAAALALRYVRFGFLTAPLGFAFWFLALDLAGLALGVESLEGEVGQWVTVAVGLCTMALGYALDRELRDARSAHTEDYAFWCYLFGLFAFWGGLTSMDSGSEVNRALYAVLNLGLIGVAVKLRRVVFLVFGALGIHLYLGHLAYRVFADSVLFPFALALLGLSLILVTVWAQRRMSAMHRQASQAAVTPAAALP